MRDLLQLMLHMRIVGLKLQDLEKTKKYYYYIITHMSTVIVGRVVQIHVMYLYGLPPTSIESSCRDFIFIFQGILVHTLNRPLAKLAKISDSKSEIILQPNVGFGSKLVRLKADDHSS